MATWVEDIVQALKNLSGQAHLGKIYAEVERIRAVPLPKTWQASIRRSIEDHSADSKGFKGRDYFRKVDRGVWALSNQVGLKIPKPLKQVKAKKREKEISIPDSYETISSILTTIREYRDYSQPDSPSWASYIQEFFHLLGFSTKQLEPRLLSLGDIGGKNSPIAIVGIIHPGENFEEIIPGIDWGSYIFYAARYNQADWGILTDGLNLKVLDCKKNNYPSIFSSSKLDEVVRDCRIDSFYEIYKVFALIKNGKGERQKVKSARKYPKSIIPTTEEYDLDYHFRRTSQYTLNIFKNLRSKIFSLSDAITEKYNKMYIGYSCTNKFCEIHFQKSQLKIWVHLNINDIFDPKSLCRDVSKVGHYGSGDTEIILRDPEHIDAIIEIIKQSFNTNR